MLLGKSESAFKARRTRTSWATQSRKARWIPNQKWFRPRPPSPLPLLRPKWSRSKSRLRRPITKCTSTRCATCRRRRPQPIRGHRAVSMGTWWWEDELVIWSADLHEFLLRITTNTKPQPIWRSLTLTSTRPRWHCRTANWITFVRTAREARKVSERISLRVGET